MGGTHSSQHTAPDAKHSSTHCCPTHEMWELPTPLIVANRSQQGDEVYGSYPLVLNRHLDLTPSKPIINTSLGTVTQKPRIGSYELNQICPTFLTQQKALSKAQGRIFNTYPRSYLNGRRNPTLMLTDYTREMSLHTSPASSKRPKAVSNEASQQEESNTTTLTSIGAFYHRQSKKIRISSSKSINSKSRFQVNWEKQPATKPLLIPVASMTTTEPDSHPIPSHARPALSLNRSTILGP
ncbi:protein IQ-DOMAIN 1-like [Dorcoceras hygrometricum]|uniref:Protein IQ-DOMAIN 1-like n=1 Tax=Dorcoceras hygrometricum TaxID=472368 RepID=A0A2Z7DJV9_9LAMI|nr:protein IQ-DOMAIN 1-like [Dorcoceras hygrometricum]